MTRTTIGLAAATLALVGAMLAGCASGPAAAPLTAVSLPTVLEAALADVRTVHVRSITTLTGSQGEAWTITIDADLAFREGGDIDVREVIHQEHPNVDLPDAEVVLVDGILYVRGELPTGEPPAAGSGPTPTGEPTPTPTPTGQPTPLPSEEPAAAEWLRIDPAASEESDDSPATALLDLIAQVKPASAAAVQRASILAVDPAGPRTVIEGTPTTPYTVIVSTDAAADLVSTFAPDLEELLPEALIYDYWIGDSGLPTRFRYTVGGVTQDVLFSDWNAPVVIRAPKVGDAP